jgi:hypothetical protein
VRSQIFRLTSKLKTHGKRKGCYALYYLLSSSKLVAEHLKCVPCIPSVNVNEVMCAYCLTYAATSNYQTVRCEISHQRPLTIILVSCLSGKALERPSSPLKKWSQCPKPSHPRPADQHREIQSADQSYPTQPSEKPTLSPNHRIHSPHPTDQRS